MSVDYTAMKDSEAYLACGPDAKKWAAWFCQCAQKDSGFTTDEGCMTTWFANAMMAMHDDMRPDLAPIVLPDGSAFVMM